MDFLGPVPFRLVWAAAVVYKQQEVPEALFEDVSLGYSLKFLGCGSVVICLLSVRKLLGQPSASQLVV